jgi:hypothetical protein
VNPFLAGDKSCMHIKSIAIRSFKRFDQLAITDVPSTARLVVCIGPNGSGKSSLFDAFNYWRRSSHVGVPNDPNYFWRQGEKVSPPFPPVKVDFHEGAPTDSANIKKYFWIRTAYRNDADFSLNQLSNQGTALNARGANRMIENEAYVNENYQRLVSDTLAEVFTGNSDALTVCQLREKLIGRIRASMSKVFDDLNLSGVGKPLSQGTFLFDKGTSRDFQYKNLSGGEKAAFDILLDLIMKISEFDNTVFCIDEPEGHMHTRLQGKLLEEIFNILPERCQLWIATHSIGMMRKAHDLGVRYPGQVCFLDFQDKDFDKPATISPSQINRQFWKRTLGVALDDLAGLVAPERIVICEGRTAAPGDPGKAEFDASCLRCIFSEKYPNTEFISAGNAADVESDRLAIGKAVSALTPGVKILRLIDGDACSEREITEFRAKGVRVLSRRHIESFLLDDEILIALCKATGHADKETEILESKRKAIAKNATSGDSALDDVKSVRGEIYVGVKQILELTKCGNTAHSFLRDTCAPLVKPNTNVYQELEKDIFS